MSALHDRQDNFRKPLDPYGAATHEVTNQPVELSDYNLFDSDAALKEAVKRERAAWATSGLEAFGARAGSAEYLEQGALANRNPPELDTHDRYGRRVDDAAQMIRREVGTDGGQSTIERGKGHGARGRIFESRVRAWLTRAWDEGRPVFLSSRTLAL